MVKQQNKNHLIKKVEFTTSGTILRTNRAVKNARAIKEKKKTVFAQEEHNIGPFPSVKRKFK